MLKYGLFLAVVAVTLPSGAIAQTASGGTCEALASQWRDVEMELAAIYAGGVTDNSAPRAAMRAAESATQMAQANSILALMTARNCPLPKTAPSPYPYLASALNCGTEQIKGNRQSELCDRTKWTAEVPKR